MTKTNAFSLLCVVVRVFAIWSALKIVMGLPALVIAVHQQAIGSISNVVYVVPGVALLVAALLWLFADKLARLALTRPDDHVFESDLDATTWFGIALAAIGAWHVFEALLGMYGVATKVVMIGTGGAEFISIISELKWRAGGYVIEGIIGAWLLLGGRGVAAVIYRLRYAGAGQVGS